ncbi:hypothetical protein F5148DRAFT_1198650 [Russula earlei]|uniref:Uncharacterized protein n=1 Tax=Russula earlei TaxID=71964 RepID=A0ACC0U9Y9_9AGAM|nr:hypothetical protein F5148DRAFT_1198650 [Russula earlei]
MKASRNPHLFPETFFTTTLDAWAAAIQQLPLEAKQCMLEQVVHYKALSDMEHEFLVVYASHEPSGSKIVLGVDRNAEELAAAASQQASSGRTTSSSSLASSSSRYLSALMHIGTSSLPSSSSSSPSSSSSSSSSPGASPHLAYDAVQVSHDGTPAPILAQHGPTVPLSTLVFSSCPCPVAADRTATSASASAFSDSRSSHTDPRPSLLHLSVLLLAIRTHFPSYALLQHQCYFFARATSLALVDLFGGVETQLEEARRAATWRGLHVSLYSAGRVALQNMLLLPLVEFPALIVPAGLFAVYSAVKLYDGNVVESELDRRRISDVKIREHAIPDKYRVAWQSFVFERRESRK